MAHHLISIIGQIAMMMKKCIIVHSMTHRANQPASLAAVYIQLRSEKLIRYSVIQEVLKARTPKFARCVLPDRTKSGPIFFPKGQLISEWLGQKSVKNLVVISF